MRLSQRGEVTKESSIHLEVLWVKEEIQRPGDGIVENEGCSEEKVVKRSELGTRGAVTQGWEKRTKWA